MRARVLQRLQSAIVKLTQPTHREVIRAGIRAMLPVDEPGRQEAIVNIAFFSAATVAPQYARVLREGYERLLAATVGLLDARGRPVSFGPASTWALRRPGCSSSSRASPDRCSSVSVLRTRVSPWSTVTLTGSSAEHCTHRPGRRSAVRTVRSLSG